jgi:hypothetical protein
MILWSCDVDHGIAPLPGKLVLTVRFIGEPPEKTQGIYLTVAPHFPPHAINELYHSPNSLPFEQDSVSTEIYLPYGHYDSIALWWYSRDIDSNLADVLSIPYDPWKLEPKGFDITPESPVYEMDVITVVWANVDRDASIEGTVNFSGAFPENTEITAVAAYKKKPEKNFEYLLYLKSIDFSIDMNENPYHYRLPVVNGGIRYVAVFWLPERAGLTDFRTIGFYRDPDNPDQAGRLNPKEGEVIENIDIYADWSLIEQAEN